MTNIYPNLIKFKRNGDGESVAQEAKNSENSNQIFIVINQSILE